jgi:hypothetical protein
MAMATPFWSDPSTNYMFLAPTAECPACHATVTDVEGEGDGAADRVLPRCPLPGPQLPSAVVLRPCGHRAPGIWGSAFMGERARRQSGDRPQAVGGAVYERAREMAVEDLTAFLSRLFSLQAELAARGAARVADKEKVDFWLVAVADRLRLLCPTVDTRAPAMLEPAPRNWASRHNLYAPIAPGTAAVAPGTTMYFDEVGRVTPEAGPGRRPAGVTVGVDWATGSSFTAVTPAGVTVGVDWAMGSSFTAVTATNRTVYENMFDSQQRRLTDQLVRSLGVPAGVFNPPPAAAPTPAPPPMPAVPRHARRRRKIRKVIDD